MVAFWTSPYRCLTALLVRSTRTASANGFGRRISARHTKRRLDGTVAVVYSLLFRIAISSNFVKPHFALQDQILADAADVGLASENKWKALLSEAVSLTCRSSRTHGPTPIRRSCAIHTRVSNPRGVDPALESILIEIVDVVSIINQRDTANRGASARVRYDAWYVPKTSRLGSNRCRN